MNLTLSVRGFFRGLYLNSNLLKKQTSLGGVRGNCPPKKSFIQSQEMQLKPSNILKSSNFVPVKDIDNQRGKVFHLTMKDVKQAVILHVNRTATERPRKELVKWAL